MRDCSTCRERAVTRQPFRRHRHLGARRSTATRSTSVSNTTTYGTPRALAHRSDRGRAQRAHADDLRPDRQGHPRRQPAGDHRRPRSAAEAEGPLQRMDMAGRGPRAAACPATTTTRSTIIRLRTYDGSHLTFPGMNRSMLRDGTTSTSTRRTPSGACSRTTTRCWRIASARARPAMMAAAAMEMKRLGLAQKPMIVVPNHLVEQWGAAFLAALSAGQIFVAGQGGISPRATGRRPWRASPPATMTR